MWLQNIIIIKRMISKYSIQKEEDIYYESLSNSSGKNNNLIEYFKVKED